MSDDPLSNAGMASTTWEWKRVKMRRPAEGPSKNRAKRLPALSRRNPRESLTITVKYRGGAEAWYELKARGRTWRFPGVYALHDVMRVINNTDDL